MLRHSMYGRDLDAWLRIFSRKQFMLARFEDMASDRAAAVYAHVLRFVGLSTSYTPPEFRNANQKSSVERPYELPAASYERLRSLVAPDVDLLDRFAASVEAAAADEMPFGEPWRQQWSAQRLQCESSSAVSEAGSCLIFLLPQVTLSNAELLVMLANGTISSSSSPNGAMARRRGPDRGIRRIKLI